MSRVESVTRTSSYEQRLRIAHEVDAKSEETLGRVIANGFEFDWNAILSGKSDESPDSIISVIEDEVFHVLRGEKFRQTIKALAINGAGLAAWMQRKNEVLAGFMNPTKVIGFAEPALHSDTKALEYWRRFLGLANNEAQQLALIDTRTQAAAIADRVASEMMARLERLHEQTVKDSLPLSEFIRQAREIAPDASRTLLETEYRTHMAEVYGAQLHEQIVSRANAFPFTQFFIINDNRTTWWICIPMGTAGPGGTGYIAATTDPTWIRWRTPAHWKCRSQHSPISYREAQRMRILAADGKTKIARVGNNPNRPFGDPPRFAENPNGSGEIREVKPQQGFGG